MKTIRLLPLACLGLLAVAPAQDKVRLKSGQSDDGKIETEDYQSLTIKSTNGNKVNRYPHDDVVDVTWGNANDLVSAVKLVTGGNYQKAQTSLAALVADDKKVRKELKQHAIYYLAVAQQRAGLLKEAVASYLELVKAFPKTWHLRAATKAVVDCRIAMGDAAAGTADADLIIKTARDGGVDDLFLSTFEIFHGRLLEAQKKMVEAKLKYDAAANVRGVAANLTAEAKLGVARCSQADGGADKAREIYRALIDQDLGNEVMAGAWNGMADIARDDASKGTPNADKLLDALFMYLRGVVEFGPAPGEGTAEYERALAGTSAVFAQLAELEKDAEKKTVYQNRARERANQLKREFPNSVYGKR